MPVRQCSKFAQETGPDLFNYAMPVRQRSNFAHETGPDLFIFKSLGSNLCMLLKKQIKLHIICIP